MKPRIGITTSPSVHEDRFLEALDRTYVTAIVRAGALPFILPVLEAEDAQDAISCVDGVLFTGGGDVDPARYGAVASPHVDGLDAARDAYEIALADAAAAAGLPMLGVCRGAQVINVAFGGTLVQHLPDVSDLSHREKDRWAEPVHPVRVSLDSCLAVVVERELVGVNSLHHQAVDLVGRGLRAVGWAGDGTIEAIEGLGHLRVLGVQWHPELLSAEPGHDALFGWLRNEAARGRTAEAPHDVVLAEAVSFGAVRAAV